MTSLPNPPITTATPDVELRALGAGVEDWVETELGDRTEASAGARAGVGVLLGVGVDMVDTVQLADMIESSGPSFVDLCWTPSEQAFCAGSIPRLAARWAAKEATMKALGRGIGEVDPIDIEVVSVEGEPPLLQLHGSAEVIARERSVGRIALSLTHERTFVFAFVVVTSQTVDPAVEAAPGVGGAHPWVHER